MNSVHDTEIATSSSQTWQGARDTNAVIAIYETHSDVEAAVDELRRAGERKGDGLTQ